MRVLTRLSLAILTATLAAVVVAAQGSGGAFLPSFDYTISGNWIHSGTTAFTGVATLTSPVITGATLTTPVLGVATATSINKVALTAPATGSTLTIADGKTFTVNQTLTLTGTTGTTMTFPSTSATIARTDAANTFTGVQTMTSAALTTPALTGTVTGTYTLGGTPTLASAAGVPYTAGVAAGYKLARGETALDGSNPTPVTTGLATIVACTLTIKATAAPGVSTSHLSYDTTSSTLNMYGWKPTSSADTTLIASAGTDTVGWICVGT